MVNVTICIAQPPSNRWSVAAITSRIYYTSLDNEIDSDHNLSELTVVLLYLEDLRDKGTQTATFLLQNIIWIELVWHKLHKKIEYKELNTTTTMEIKWSQIFEKKISLFSSEKILDKQRLMHPISHHKNMYPSCLWTQKYNQTLPRINNQCDFKL